MQSERSGMRGGGFKLKVGDFQARDRRNFATACNKVNFFESSEVEIYYSVVDVGFLFKNYVLLALKHKKGLNLYELAMTDELNGRESLTHLEHMPTFQKVRRFNSRQKFTARNKQITVTFDDNESWKFIFKNKDVYYSWRELLQQVSGDKPLGESLLSKELKRNFEYLEWRSRNPTARSNFFESVLDVSTTFKKEMEETKRYVGVNTEEIIGRMVCERRDKITMQRQVEDARRLNNVYKETLLEIDKSISM